MLVHCWICNDGVILPAGPVCHGKKKALRDSELVRSQNVALCKAFGLPLEGSCFEQFCNDVASCCCCESCFKRLDEIKDIVKNLEDLNHSLEVLKKDVKRCLELATTATASSDEADDDEVTSWCPKDGSSLSSAEDNSGEGIGRIVSVESVAGKEFDELKVKEEVPETIEPSSSSSLDDNFWDLNLNNDGESMEDFTVAGKSWSEEQTKLNSLRFRIINYLNPKSPVEQKTKSTNYSNSNVEKHKRLVVKLKRIDISHVKKEREGSSKSSAGRSDNMIQDDQISEEWYCSQVSEGKSSQRRSSRKRKIPMKLQEDLEEDSISKELNVPVIKEDPDDEAWELPSDAEEEGGDDQELTEENKLPEHPIKLLQFKGRKPTNSVYCEKCKRNYGSSFDLQIHIKKRHEGNRRPFSCEVAGCGKSFRLRSSWLHHKQFHLNGQAEKRFSCTECGKSYETNNSLQRHISVHTGKWKYPCNYEGCDKGFHRPSELKTHVDLCHEKREEFKCHFCPERFLTKRKRIFHESSVHPEQPLNANTTCEYCHKVFSSVDALKCHKIQVHSEKSKFTCDECGHGFAKLSWLNRHKLQHSNEKTFACEYCDEKFRFPNSLSSHKMKHEGKFPHVCTVCGKKFTLLHQLKIHLSIHSEDKSYVCEYCGKTFSVHTYLRHHVRRMHFKELGLPELPVYYVREKNRKRNKKTPGTTTAATTSSSLSNRKSKAESDQKRKNSNNNKIMRVLEVHNELKNQEQQQMECILSGMNVGEETLIITNANGSSNVEVEFVNVDVLEYVVETYEETGIEVVSQDEMIKEGELLEQVEVVHHHELETQKIETDPFIEFIVTQAN